MSNLGFLLYLLFIFSWFIHLTSRLTFLGNIRFDLLLICSIFVLSLIFKNSSAKYSGHETTNSIMILMLYVIVTIPFVEWPGSVINNIENWLKSLAYYYFTVTIINTENRLKIFMYTFILVQTIRVIEPLYLHVTEGYWGSYASMQNWEYMYRLAGAPHDIINPNGLAFVILTVIPFVYYLSGLSVVNRIYFIMITPALIYALMLTGSRSGMIGIIAIAIMIVCYSKKKLMLLGVMVTLAVILVINMPEAMKDRYISIIDPSTSHSGTAEGRVSGIIDDIELSLRRPVFGHGLGTSLEAGAHYGNRYQISHNLYAEILIELGIMGLIIFISYIWHIVKNMINTAKIIENKEIKNCYFISLKKGMMTWIVMNIIFSFASYGLSSYEWYLFGGLSVVLLRLCNMPEFKAAIA